MLRPALDRLEFREWIGTLDGRPTLWVRRLVDWRGWRASLHRMVATDDAGCFHTHPAWALRIVLAGGYVEELEHGESVSWRPGMVGLVRPSLSHRISELADGVASYSLWIRGPKCARIELRGEGWPKSSGDPDGV